MKLKGKICDICGKLVYRHNFHEYEIRKRFPEYLWYQPQLECLQSRMVFCKDCHRRMTERVMKNKAERKEDND